MSDRVECDHCGLKVRLLADGTYPDHDHTTYRLGPRGGVDRRSGVRQQCERSGTRYAFHRGTFYATKRDSNGIATEWGAFCRCGRSWTGPTYDAAALPWEEHLASSPVEGKTTTEADRG